jgi:hypothetical protein
MKGAVLVHVTPKGLDIASIDFHMFGPMKEALKGGRFSSNEEVIGVVQNWLKAQQKNFFSDGLKRTCETLKPVR